MSIWGHCERCDTWFPCPADGAIHWACPECGVEPLRIENRADVTPDPPPDVTAAQGDAAGRAG